MGKAEFEGVQQMKPGATHRMRGDKKKYLITHSLNETDSVEKVMFDHVIKDYHQNAYVHGS